MFFAITCFPFVAQFVIVRANKETAPVSEQVAMDGCVNMRLHFSFHFS